MRSSPRELLCPTVVAPAHLTVCSGLLDDLSPSGAEGHRIAGAHASSRQGAMAATGGDVGASGSGGGGGSRRLSGIAGAGSAVEQMEQLLQNLPK